MSNSATKLEAAHKNNQENNSCAGSGQHSCPLQQCELTSLMVSCDSDRNFILDVVNGKPTLNDRDFAIQVVATTTRPRIMKLEFDGRCKDARQGNQSPDSEDHSLKYRWNYANSCPSVAIYGDDTNVDQPHPIKVAVYPPPAKTESEGFVGFIKEFFLPPAESITGAKYKVQSKKCSGDGRISAIIDAYPVTKWGGRISMGYKQPESFEAVDENRGKKPTSVTGAGNWELGGEISIRRDERTWKLNGSTDQNWFMGLRGALDGMVSIFSDIEKFNNQGKKRRKKLDVEWPKVTLGGELELQEVAKDYSVDFGGKINLSFDPLIEAKFQQDILPWVLRLSAGPYAEFLMYAKQAAEDGIGMQKGSIQVPVMMMLSVNGRVGGDIEGTKKAGESWSVAGGVGAKLTFMLKGIVEVRGHLFTIEFAAGATISIKGAEGGGEGVGIIGELKILLENNSPALQGQLTLTGLAIYYSCYKKIGARSRETQNGDASNMKIREQGANRTVNESEDKIINTDEERLFVKILDKKTWPDQSDITGVSNVKY